MTVAPARPFPAAAAYERRVADLRSALRAAEERGTRDGRVDAETVSLLRDAGFFSLAIPETFGGPGLSLAAYVRLVAAIAAEAPSTALLVVMPSGTTAICRLPAHLVPEAEREGFRARMDRVAREALAGRLYAVANTEPGTGGDLANTRTTALPHASGRIVLNGVKSFASFGAKADVLMCAARGEDGGVDAWLVAADAPGVLWDDGWDALGMRATESVSLRLADAPAEGLLGYRGMLLSHNARHWSTLGFAAVFAGLARAAVEEARPAAGTSALADVRLAEAATRAAAAAAFVEAVAAEGEEWPLPAGYRTRATMAKTFAAETAVAAAETALVLLGGRVYAKRGRAASLLADALAGPLLRPPLPLAYADVAKSLAPASR